MSHNVLINGTSHNLTGGGTKVNGTSYQIKQGKVLIEGTNKTLSFGLTNLTNTYWRWDSYTTKVSGTPYKINFSVSAVSSTTVFTTIYCPFSVNYEGANQRFYAQGNYGHYVGISGTRWGYELLGGSGSWNNNDNCRRFHIIDGDDVANPDLISYLCEHATQCDSNWNPL